MILGIMVVRREPPAGLEPAATGFPGIRAYVAWAYKAGALPS